MLTASQAHRLYEALGNVAEALPIANRESFYRVCRRIAWHLPDTYFHRYLRGQKLYPLLTDLVRDDWHWILKTLPDDGAADMFWRWATDAGYRRATST